MDQKSLIAWRKNPKLIGKDEVRDLENLLQEFPYFSMGQILLAKGYKNLNHYKLMEQIRKATLYCQDREWFYHFIHSESGHAQKKELESKQVVENKKVETKQVESAVEVITEKKVPVEQSPRKKEVVEAPFKLKKDLAWKVETLESKTKADTVEEVLPKEVVKPALKRRGRPPKVKEEEVNVTPKKRGRPPLLKKDIVVPPAPKKRGRPPKKKIEENKDLKLVKTDAKPTIVKKEEEVKTTPKRRGRPSKAKKELGIKPDLKKANEKVEPLEKKEAKATPKKQSKKKKKSQKKKAKVVLDEKALLDELMLSNIQYNLEDHFTLEEELVIEEKNNTDEPTDFFSWLKSTEGKSSQVEQKTTKKKKDGKDENKPHKSLITIEKFLSNKSNAKKKVSFFSPAEMAKRSDSLESEIVSETLAKLYEEQERYPEAILTYEKLILLFPQKETYFATRIKNLRKLDKK